MIHKSKSENPSLEEFKALYKKRIENFYSYLNANDTVSYTHLTLPTT